METRHTPAERGTKVALYVEGEEVSWLTIHDLEMRIGNVPVRLGGVGGVRTKEEHRRKGYARRVMEDSNTFMKEAGFDVALLFGIRDFYPKFGYAVCEAECELTVSTRYAERAAASLGFTEADRADLELVRGLYEEMNSSRTGSVVRRKDAWRGFRMGSRFRTKTDCFVAKAPSGGLEGYVVLDSNPEETVSAELAARSHEVYEAALRFLAEDAVEKRAGGIRVTCPYDYPFLVAASRFGVEVRLSRRRCGGPMGRVINQRPLLEKLLPLFSERLRGSGLEGEAFALAITTELGRTVIGFDGREAGLEESAAADSCEVPAPGLVQMVMGYCGPAEAGARFEGRIALDAVEALFPREEAHTWRPDRF